MDLVKENLDRYFKGLDHKPYGEQLVDIVMRCRAANTDYHDDPEFQRVSREADDFFRSQQIRKMKEYNSRMGKYYAGRPICQKCLNKGTVAILRGMEFALAPCSCSAGRDEDD